MTRTFADDSHLNPREGTSEWIANQLIEDLEKQLLRMRVQYSGRLLKSDAEAYGDKYKVESSISRAKLKEQRASVLGDLRTAVGHLIDIEDAIESIEDNPVG